MSASIHPGVSRFAPEQEAAIRSELDAILKSPQFSGSRRCHELLEFIVNKALDGTYEHLTERFIGSLVFGRPIDYETATDAIVRVRANDARRRLAHYQMEHGRDSRVRISLQSGNYIPEFHFTAQDVEVLSPGALSEPVAAPPERVSSLSALMPVAEGQRNLSSIERTSAGWRLRIWPFLAGALVALLLAGAVKLVRDQRRTTAPLEQVWEPILDDPNPVLITVGRPHAPGEIDQMPSNSLTVREHFIQPGFRVSITAASAISQIAGLLQVRGKSYRIHESDSNTLDDLHHRPVVLVNALNNKWTLLLLKPLRFRFNSIASGQEDYTYIEDEEHPEQHQWKVDWQQPYMKESVDYAIIGRFYSTTTASPVIILAGISSNGTEAAGEYMASAEKLAELSRSAHNSLTRNFEAVLKIEVVGGNTGAVTVVASKFW